MNVVVAYIGEAVFFYADLADWVRTLDKDPDDPMFDALSLMEGDPDILKCGGKKMYFIDVTLGETKYILTSDYPDDKEKEMLTQFHGENRIAYYEPVESCWDVFKSLPDAIAYRCGMGYFYGIHKHKTI